MAYDALTEVQARERASNALRSGKWDAKAQLSSDGAILSALVERGESLNGRVRKFRSNAVFETEFDRNRKFIHAFGSHTPAWKQKLAHGALAYVMHLNSFLYKNLSIRRTCVRLGA